MAMDKATETELKRGEGLLTKVKRIRDGGPTKANPNHDAQGRFSSGDGGSNQSFGEAHQNLIDQGFVHEGFRDRGTGMLAETIHIYKHPDGRTRKLTQGPIPKPVPIGKRP